MTELSGRTVAYAYDNLYRLTSEIIAGATAQNGTINYQYDPVGNRLQLNSTVAAIPTTGLLQYDANDRASTDLYDAEGNTINNSGLANVYDFENRLVQRGAVTMKYDGDGNRVQELVGEGLGTYLIADVNPTGYAQILDEVGGGAVQRTHTWGLEQIDESGFLGGENAATAFYGYDGHGSVRYLTNSAGAVTDTYDYDAFGNRITSTGSTINNTLFAGEWFDPALGIYYNRARYYDERSGRFWTMDTDEGVLKEPLSLHQYLYVYANPVSSTDHTGNFLDTIDFATSGLADLVNSGTTAGRWLIIGARATALARQAVAALTAAAIIASTLAFSLGAGGSGTSAINGQEGEGAPVQITVYRDADGTNPGAFSFTPPTYPDIDKREISLLETPKRDRKYVIPFQVAYQLPKTPKFTVGGIVDEMLMNLTLQVRYSPATTQATGRC